jgi:hypothetical protein
MLTVVSRPSQPQDRLVVSNIHRNGCKLTWQAPADDGGLPVEYVVEKFVVHANAWYAREIKRGDQIGRIFAEWAIVN